MADEGMDMENHDIPLRVAPQDVQLGPATARYPPGARFGPRRLDDFELVWLMSGSARWDANDQPTRHLVPGQVLLAPPGVVDQFRWDEKTSTRHGYVHFRLPNHSGERWPLLRTMTADDPLDGLLRYLLWLAGAPARASRARIAEVLGLALDIFVHGPWPGDDDGAGWPAPLAALAEAVALAWADGMRQVSLTELAVATGFSSGHLSRSFRAHLGVPIIAGLEILRLEQAELMLRRSDLAVAQIGRLCGYPDALHFSRRFRALFGRPPRSSRQAGALPTPAQVSLLRPFGNRVATLNPEKHS